MAVPLISLYNIIIHCPLPVWPLLSWHSKYTQRYCTFDKVCAPCNLCFIECKYCVDISQPTYIMCSSCKMYWPGTSGKRTSLWVYTPPPVIYVVKGHHKFHQPHPCTTGKVFHVLKQVRRGRMRTPLYWLYARSHDNFGAIIIDREDTIIV